MIDRQHNVERFMLRHGLRHDPMTHILDLVSEVGELAKLLLQANAYGQGAPDPTVDFSEELGDVLYSLLALAVALDLDAGEAVDQALRKYENRLREHGGPGST